MRVLVCGGRKYRNWQNVCTALDCFVATIAPVTVVVHGCAPGADLLGRKWALLRSLKEDPYPALWHDMTARPLVLRYSSFGKAYNVAAGGIRNQRMLDEGEPGAVVHFEGGKGTADMVMRARRHRKKVNPALRIFCATEQGGLEEEEA